MINCVNVADYFNDRIIKSGFVRATGDIETRHFCLDCEHVFVKSSKDNQCPKCLGGKIVPYAENR